MANAKVTLNGVTLIDLTSDTVASDNLLNGYIAHRSDGEVITGTYVPVSVSLIPGNTDPTESSQHITPPSGYDGFEYFDVGAISSDYIGSNIPTRSSSDLTVSGATVSVPSGYYGTATSKAVSTGSAITPETVIIADPTLSINSSTGIITGVVSKIQNITPSVIPGYISSGIAGTVTVDGGNLLALSTQAGTTISPTESEQIAVAAGKYTLGAIKVAAIPSKYKDTTGTDAVASQVLSGKKFVNSTGLVTGTMTDRGAVNKVLTTARDEDVYTVPSGYHNGSGVVRIYPEIKSGIVPTKSQQNIYPSTGSVLSLVTISAIPSAYQDVTGVTATASEVLVSKVFVDSSGTEITGTMPNIGAVNTIISVSSPSYTIPSGYHNGNGKVQIDAEMGWITPATTSQVINASYGRVLSRVYVDAIPSQYIVTTDATATASDILYNQTAYVNGSKITGTFELARVNDTTLILNNTNSSVNGTTLII